MSLVLCDDAHISQLNWEYRDKQGPTDVLSFEMDSPPGYPYHLLGDIIVSLETAQRQADERGYPPPPPFRISSSQATWALHTEEKHLLHSSLDGNSNMA